MRLVATALGLALASTPALAAAQEQPSDTPTMPAPQQSDAPVWKATSGGKPSTGLALEALHNYAACAVKRTPDGAARLLGLDVNGVPYRAELARFAKGHSYCMTNGRIAFGGLPFQGALAEALIAQRYAATPIANAVATAPAELKGRYEPEAIGLCLVRHQPAAATALLASQPASEQEHAALDQVVPVLPGCVVSGMTMKMNRPAVRAMMALGAYRVLSGNPAGN